MVVNAKSRWLGDSVVNFQNCNRLTLAQENTVFLGVHFLKNVPKSRYFCQTLVHSGENCPMAIWLRCGALPTQEGCQGVPKTSFPRKTCFSCPFQSEQVSWCRKTSVFIGHTHHSHISFMNASCQTVVTSTFSLHQQFHCAAKPRPFSLPTYRLFVLFWHNSRLNRV